MPTATSAASRSASLRRPTSSRCWGQKKSSGRGAHTSWAISHEELQRYQREGLRRVSATAMHLAGHTRPRDDNQGL